MENAKKKIGKDKLKILDLTIKKKENQFSIKSTLKKKKQKKKENFQINSIKLIKVED